jgi:hypothetical protein
MCRNLFSLTLSTAQFTISTGRLVVNIQEGFGKKLPWCILWHYTDFGLRKTKKKKKLGHNHTSQAKN